MQSDNEIWSDNEHIMRNTFLEKSNTKCGRETSPRAFSGKLKLSISLNQ